MGKKEQELQIEIMYSREDFEKVYTIEKVPGFLGVDYQYISELRNEFMNDFKIFTEVKMNYLSEDDQILPINQGFFLTYEQLEKVFDGNFVIMITPQVDQLEGKITEIEDRIKVLQKQIKQVRKIKQAQATEAKQMYLKKHISLPESMRKQISEMPRQKIIDIGILFSQPLVQKRDENQDVRVLAEPVKYREQIQRLKSSLEKTGRMRIFIKCSIANVKALKKLVEQKSKILHVICHGNVETQKKTGIQQGVLQFQQQNVIGCMDKMYGKDIPKFLDNIHSDSKPKLVFVNACHSELIGDAFIQSGVPFAVVIQSSQKIEDTAAQLFAQKFYYSIFNGMSVKYSFQDAISSLNRQNRAINLNICCCMHTLAHQPKCLFKQMQDQRGKLIAHQLCHVPICKCSKRHLNIHKTDCTWAIETLFSINRQFRIYNQNMDEYRKPTVEQLQKQYQQLYICCCSTKSLKIPHDETQKFKFKFAKDANPNQTLYQPLPFYEYEAQVIDDTALELKGNFVRGEKLFGRSLNIYTLVHEIKQNVKVILVYGAQGSGKSKVVTRAVSYMIQRGFFKDQYLYIDLKDVTNSIDFNFQMTEKVKYLKLNSLNAIYSYFETSQMVIVMDSVDGFIKASYSEFKIQIQKIITKMSNVKLILVLNQKTVKNLDVSIFNETRYFLEPLKKFAASDMFILHAKEFLKDINMKEVWKLFEDENRRVPQRILDMVHFIKSHFTTKISIKQLTDKIQSQKTKQIETQKFLSQNIKQLQKQDIQTFKVFMFLCEFRDGLTQLDFNIMSSHSQQQNTQQTILIPQNWKQLLCRLIYHDQTQKSDDIEQGDYYFCDVQIISDLKKIKVKKYILDYMIQSNQFSNSEIKFNALAYLSISTMGWLKFLRQNYYYHQKLVEYCNISNAGIFQIQRESKFSQFYDEGQYFPDLVQNMSKSTKKKYHIDQGIKNLFKRKKSLLRNISSTSIFLHKTNIMQLYRNDYSSYYASLSDDRKKLFRYYYLTLMLNIPSNIKIMDDNTKKQFLNYCIDNSIIKVKSLEKEPSKTINLCLVKLYMMRIVVDLSDKTFPDLATFRPHFESIDNAMKIWDEKLEICRIINMDCYLLKLGIIYKQLKISNKPETYTDVLEKGHKFKMQYQKASHQLPGNLILQAKFQLMMTQCFFLTLEKTKQNHRGFDVFQISFEYSKKQTQLEQAVNTFSKYNLKFLQVRTMIKVVRISFSLSKKKKNNDAALEDFFRLKFEYIVKIRQILNNPMYNIILQQSQTQLNELQQRINNKIQESTQNFIVFLRSCPLLSSKDTGFLNSVRRTYNFKSIIKSVFQGQESILDDPKPSRAVSVRFQILTKKSVTNIINQGCAIVFLTIDAMVTQNQQIFLIFQQDDLPIENKIQLKKFLEQLNFKNVGVIVICGQYAHIVGSRIRQMQGQTPTIITVCFNIKHHENEVRNNYYDMGYQLYSMKSLQREAFQIFMKSLVQKIVFSNFKIKNQHIANIAISAKENTIIHLMRFSKQTSNQDNLRSIFVVQTHLAKMKLLELQFHSGQYHNISTQRSTLTNIPLLDTTFVGRQKIIIQTMQQLLLSKSENKPCYLNVFGNRRIGKTLFLKELGTRLIERGHFKKGLYFLNGWQISKDHKGNIEQYLQKNKSTIFQKNYLDSISDILLIIDDYHAIKDQSSSYFFTSIFSKPINIVFCTYQKLSMKDFPSLDKKSFNFFQLKKFTQQQSSLLSYTFIPLFDFKSYINKFQNTFFSLKKDKKTPQMIIDKFKSILFNAKEDPIMSLYPNYQLLMNKMYQFETKKPKKGFKIKNLFK